VVGAEREEAAAQVVATEVEAGAGGAVAPIDDYRVRVWMPRSVKVPLSVAVSPSLRVRHRAPAGDSQEAHVDRHRCTAIGASVLRVRDRDADGVGIRGVALELLSRYG